MKTKLFAAALAALTLATAGAASAQDWRRNDNDRSWNNERIGNVRSTITVRKDGRVMTFARGDRMFYRLVARPFNFQPGFIYAYTDRCNRQGCIAFVFDNYHRRPIDRIFAPHLRDARYAWRESGDFDRNYSRFGDYDRDERGWNNNDDRMYRQDRGGLEGGPSR